jgi:hypothetical protein
MPSHHEEMKMKKVPTVTDQYSHKKLYPWQKAWQEEFFAFA